MSVFIELIWVHILFITKQTIWQKSEIISSFHKCWRPKVHWFGIRSPQNHKLAVATKTFFRTISAGTVTSNVTCKWRAVCESRRPPGPPQGKPPPGYPVVKYCKVWYSAVLCNVHCTPLQCSVQQCSAAQCAAAKQCNAGYNSTVQCTVEQNSVLLPNDHQQGLVLVFGLHCVN